MIALFIGERIMAAAVTYKDRWISPDNERTIFRHSRVINAVTNAVAPCLHLQEGDPVSDLPELVADYGGGEGVQQLTRRIRGARFWEETFGVDVGPEGEFPVRAFREFWYGPDGERPEYPNCVTHLDPVWCPSTFLDENGEEQPFRVKDLKKMVHGTFGESRMTPLHIRWADIQEMPAGTGSWVVPRKSFLQRTAHSYADKERVEGYEQEPSLGEGLTALALNLDGENPIYQVMGEVGYCAETIEDKRFVLHHPILKPFIEAANAYPTTIKVSKQSDPPVRDPTPIGFVQQTIGLLSLWKAPRER
jgi:hypothetical protein